jgi:hypothetical protein
LGGAANLSELAARILSELAEAWAKNISSTVNTVTDRTGEEQELANSIEALEELVRAELAVLRPDGIQELTAELSMELLPRLASNIRFDSDDHLWKWSENLPMVEIVATEKGRELAFEILDERGYQWWRQKKPEESA